MSVVIVVITAAVAFAIPVIIIVRKRVLAFKAAEIVKEIEPMIEPALRELSSFYTFSHYITESERTHLCQKYSWLAEQLNKVSGTKAIKCPSVNNSAERIVKALCKSSDAKSENNRNFIKRQLEMNRDFFDSVLKYPLDTQQREAIVSLEDNVLVISSAGSGKTMTTVGKVRYLVDRQGVEPSRILLITFTRKAADSLSERLGEKELKCVTFHKLAIDIIADVTGRKPTIAGGSIPALAYHDLMDNDNDFRSAVSDYILRSRYKMPDQFEFDSREAYIEARMKYGVNSYYKDMDGRPVFCKSDEESQICDYLGRHGIKFRYEEKYEKGTVDKEYRQYCPDFSIYFVDKDGKEKRIYLEHFAVNEYGHCPQWFSRDEERIYLEGIEWKRKLHRQYGTVLLETRSADFHNGEVYSRLEQQLLAAGVKVDNEIRGDFTRELAYQEHSILDMLTAFNFLLKSKGESISQLRKEADRKDRDTIEGIIIPFISRYRKICEEKDSIDVTDAIIQATELCNTGHRPDYDYILVDEFQDISLDRYRFLQSLRRKEPLTKLFCVGDDWQSIYRFAGSDISLFKHFSSYFGYTKECRMEMTYRFGNPCVERSSRFILANKEQKEKTVRPFSASIKTDLRFIAANGHSGMAEKVREIISAIPQDSSIYILGRYSSDVRTLNTFGFSITYENDGKVYVMCNGRRMTFMTVHQSKGLESDYVILLNCNSGTKGFPSEIADAPVLNYVLSEPDSFEFSEERRVFYVAITRAKVCTYVLYDPQKPSPFISEFVSGIGFQKPKKTDIPQSERCPLCHCGKKVLIKKGKAVNGNPYYCYTCSNESYGCDYRETVFVNLNRYASQSSIVRKRN